MWSLLLSSCELVTPRLLLRGSALGQSLGNECTQGGFRQSATRTMEGSMACYVDFLISACFAFVLGIYFGPDEAKMGLPMVNCGLSRCLGI